MSIIIGNYEIEDWYTNSPITQKHNVIWFRAIYQNISTGIRQYLTLISVSDMIDEHKNKYGYVQLGPDPLRLKNIIPLDIPGSIDHAKLVIDNVLLRLSKLETFT